MWPLQIMLLVMSPKVLEEIVNADSGAPCSPRHSRKKIFLGINRPVCLFANYFYIIFIDRFVEESPGPSRH